MVYDEKCRRRVIEHKDTGHTYKEADEVFGIDSTRYYSRKQQLEESSSLEYRSPKERRGKINKSEPARYSLDSTTVKTHPAPHGAEKKGRAGIGKNRGGWNTKIHAVTAGDRRSAAFRLSGGNVSDAGERWVLLKTIGIRKHTGNLLIERAYEDERIQLMAQESGYTPVVPPKRNRAHPWEYDEEWFFWRLKGFRGMCDRYDKRACMFSACIYLACICIALPCVNTP
jgi:hypothetical protein